MTVKPLPRESNQKNAIPPSLIYSLIKLKSRGIKKCLNGYDLENNIYSILTK